MLASLAWGANKLFFWLGGLKTLPSLHGVNQSVSGWRVGRIFSSGQINKKKSQELRKLPDASYLESQI